MNKLQIKAIKFVKFIKNKYGHYGYPLHIILNKSLKYKDKYNLSDEEFELFKQYYQKLLNSRNNINEYNILVPNTNMSKIFGTDPYKKKIELDINKENKQIIDNILNIYELSKIDWKSVMLQSVQYNINNLNQTENKNNNNINYLSYIHPVIAAMFIPKIDEFDEYFLLTNLAYIFKCKFIGEPLITYHNYLLLFNLITDNNDIVCNSDSPLKDILNRIMLQINLWKVVLRLRQCGFYDTYDSNSAADFMLNIDNCRISLYDAPDLLMIGDENVILRRLLNSLSYKCATINSLSTSSSLFNNQQFQTSTMNIPLNFIQTLKIPILYIKLPIVSIQPQIQNNDIYLEKNLSSISPILYNGKLESRIFNVVNTNGTLIFNIPRRTYKPLSNNIFNFSNIPSHSIGLEVLNNYPVYSHTEIDVIKQKLFIKSIVVLNEKQDKFIYKSKTFIFNNNNT